MNMQDLSAISRMRGLFVCYHTLLSRAGLFFVLKTGQNVTAQHVLSAIQPITLKKRLHGDLEFT